MAETGNTTIVRFAEPHEFDRVCAAYAAWGYPARPLESDVIFTAHAGDELIGIVRRTVEHGHLMLRGMHVAPAWQRCGVGARLLAAFEADLPNQPCLCVPYTHLESFYGSIGFARIADDSAPRFLQERLAAYRAQGRSMMIMRRPASGQ